MYYSKKDILPTFKKRRTISINALLNFESRLSHLSAVYNLHVRFSKNKILAFNNPCICKLSHHSQANYNSNEVALSSS